MTFVHHRTQSIYDFGHFKTVFFFRELYLQSIMLSCVTLRIKENTILNEGKAITDLSDVAKMMTP